MNRKHESRFWSSTGMRSLQAQIDELWGYVWLLRAHPPTAPEPVHPDADLYGDGPMAARPLNVVAVDHDVAAHAVTEEVASQLQPDAYEVKNLGYGWYQVMDSDGKPTHEGKLRKDKADEVWRASMAGV